MARVTLLRRGWLSHGELNAPKVDFGCYLLCLLHSTHPEIGVGSWHGNSVAFRGIEFRQNELTFNRAMRYGEDELTHNREVSSDRMN